jgi:hypothetical protein
MNDAFGVSTASAERSRVCMEEFCPAPSLMQPRSFVLTSSCFALGSRAVNLNEWLFTVIFRPPRAVKLLSLLLLFTLPIAAQALDFSYTTSSGTITITGYTGSGGAVTIPDTIAGLPVTSIGDWAFYDTTSLTSVKIPNTVTNIGLGAFSGCTGLTKGASINNIYTSEC